MTGPRRIAIVGAGMAGATLAADLVAAGESPVIFEKSRGLGGRMATRRRDALRFDHGAPSFDAGRPGFDAVIDAWTRAGAAAPWGTAHVGLPGMSGPAKALIADLPVQLGTRVEALRREAERWHVQTGLGPEAAWHGPFDLLLSAAPGAQFAPVLETAGVVLPELDPLSYDPCWALMVAWDAAPPLQSATPDGTVLASILDNGSKPGRAGNTWVVHATAAWSREHLEQNADDAARRLFAALQERADGPLPEPSFRTAHRWRYARTARALGAPCVWRPELGLGMCGDWCLGPNVADAWASGRALAERVLDEAG